MKIIIEEPTGAEEDCIIIKCREMTPQLLHIIARLKTHEELLAYDDDGLHRIRPCDIYYFEVVDNKTFLYCRNKFYEAKQRLYELEENLVGSDFLRASKSVIINLSKIDALTPALNGRFEALLDNGEKLIISRQYVGDLKKRLGV